MSRYLWQTVCGGGVSEQAGVQKPQQLCACVRACVRVAGDLKHVQASEDVASMLDRLVQLDDISVTLPVHVLEENLQKVQLVKHTHVCLFCVL